MLIVRERRKRDCAHLPPQSCKRHPELVARESVGVTTATIVDKPEGLPEQTQSEGQGSVVTNDEVFDSAAFLDTGILWQQDINMIEKIVAKKEIRQIPSQQLPYPSLFAREEPTVQEINGMMALNGATTHVMQGSNIEDRVERHRAKHRIVNMSTEQIERQRARKRISNMTLDQIEKQRARNRIQNMTPEQIERQRARNRVANMTAEQIERQRARNRIKNMTPDEIEKQRARNRKFSAKPTPATLLSANDRASVDDSLTTLREEQGSNSGSEGNQQERASSVSISSLSEAS